MVAVVVLGAAGAAVLTPRSPPDEVATGDDEVVMPEREDLQEPDGRRQDGGPRVTCDRAGAPVDCVAWTHDLVSASSAPGSHSWWVELPQDRVLAQDTEAVVALSRTSGEVAWRKEFVDDEGPAGAPWVLGDEVIAISAGEAVRALSLADGSERWSVDDARLAVPGGDLGPLGTIYTVQLDGGGSFLAAHDADGVVRWRHTIAEEVPGRRPVRVEVFESGSVVFTLVEGPGHGLEAVALDRDEGTQLWRRTDSRPVHATRDVAVVQEVDRVVEEQDDQTMVSESPTAVVGLDPTDGTQRWRHDLGAEGPPFQIVDDVLVAVEADGLSGIDLATGQELWHTDRAPDERLVFTTSPWGRTVISPHRRVVSFAPRDRRVVARDPGTGELVWETEMDQLVGHMSTVDDAIVAMRSGSRSDDHATVSEITFIHIDPATGQVTDAVTVESESHPQLVARDLLADPTNGWAIRLDLSRRLPRRE